MYNLVWQSMRKGYYLPSSLSMCVLFSVHCVVLLRKSPFIAPTISGMLFVTAQGNISIPIHYVTCAYRYNDNS